MKPIVRISLRATFQAALLTALWAGVAVRAEDLSKPPNLETLPEPAPGARISADEPVITIRRQDGAEFKEYRVQGQLVAVKVTPPVGKPYWLIERNGSMQRHDGPSPNLTVPSWLVLEW